MVTPFSLPNPGALNARPRLEETFGSRPELTRYRAGAALGGPLRKDRTFYYAAFERERTDRETASDLDAATLATINTALAGEAFRRSGVRRLTQGLFPAMFTESELSGKTEASDLELAIRDGGCGSDDDARHCRRLQYWRTHRSERQRNGENGRSAPHRDVDGDRRKPRDQRASGARRTP